MTPPLVFVAALTPDRVIGVAGRLPWHIPTDLRRFKALTLGAPVIMGRKTFAAIGRVLPERTTIVLSRTFRPPGGEVLSAATLEDALAAASCVAHATGARAITVAGGGEVFAALLPRADRLHLTRVDLTVAGDVYFPALDPTDWREVSRRTPPRAPQDDASVTFLDLERQTAGPL